MLTTDGSVVTQHIHVEMHKVDTVSDLEEFSSARGTAACVWYCKGWAQGSKETMKKRHV